MAKLQSLIIAFQWQLVVFNYISFFFITQISYALSYDYVKTMDPKFLELPEQKLTHFHFYFHDTYGGSNPTVVQIVPPASNTSTTMFGLVSMMDDPLTEGPNLSSRLIGKAQGFYGSSSQEEVSFILAMNCVFTEERYNGSTITIFGRDPILSEVREMPVIGGTGVFRFASGFAQASTYSVNLTTGDAIVEYNVYVLHY
ncbi:hypothetical protein K2173_010923 [Erythroxylum novogranatense]|uniref:Dirigent protein n=1 Tax=Erythroxylum novogranatense TaxID=1862640 RepID=A0AAV8T085_9ROSI|nr:hypothetical protein K2173_010923 [Erythroxylum novogranatense]